MQNLYLRWGLALLGFSGVIALFFPFSANHGVIEAWEFGGRFILPVVTLPFLISFGFVTLIITKRPLGWMNPAGYTAAVLVSAVALSDVYEFLFVAMFAIIPSVCVVLAVFRNVSDEPGSRGLVALQCTYATHLSFYLMGFSQDPFGTGYWLAMLALIGTLGQIIVLAKKIWRIIALFFPAGLMWAMPFVD